MELKRYKAIYRSDEEFEFLKNKKGTKIWEFIDITDEEYQSLKSKMKSMNNGERIIIYSNEKIEFKLMKIRNKVQEIVHFYGTKPFTECVKEMLEIPGVADSIFEKARKSVEAKAKEKEKE